MGVKERLLAIASLAEEAESKGHVEASNAVDDVLMKIAKSGGGEKLEGIREGLEAALQLMNSAGDNLYALKDVREYLRSVADNMPEVQQPTLETPKAAEDLGALMAFDV